jgi:hypothetical protein
VVGGKTLKGRGKREREEGKGRGKGKRRGEEGREEKKEH